jgi:uroporphyrinogen III methyltransferase/synthase
MNPSAVPQFSEVNANGSVTLVGAGPGDPDLLTLGAVRALRNADVILYDALVSPAALDHCAAGAERIAVGKRAGAHSMSQAEINSLLLAKAREGKRVVRLKGGDPFVFGRGGEEALACREAGVAFAVVPGVTSAVAVPAYAGVPVTHRGLARSFAVVTGSEGGETETNWAALAGIDTVVVLMGAASLGETAAALVAAGRDAGTPAVSISNGTLPGQRSVQGRLEDIGRLVAEAGLPTPLITVIGAVAALAPDLAWRGRLPLSGKSVVVTRTRTQASGLRGLLEALGADVVEAPVLQIQHQADGLITDERLESRWDWAVFTSQNAVASFFEALEAVGRDARALGSTKVAAVGQATAEALAAQGIRADFVPTVATGECLAAELPRVHGARILVGGGSLNSNALPDGLRARGAHIEEVTLYRTLPAPLDDGLAASVLGADAITFASGSSARFLKQALGERELPASLKLCAIGPQAAQASREAFGRVDAVASKPSIEALAAAVGEAMS